MLNSGPVIWVLSVFVCPYRRVIFSVVVVTSLHYAAQLGPASAVVQFRSPQLMQSIAYSVVVSTSLFKCDIVLYVVKKSTCTLTCPGICHGAIFYFILSVCVVSVCDTMPPLRKRRIV